MPMSRASMIRALAWQRHGLRPWYARMILWSHLRGRPFGHASICRINRDMRQMGQHFGFAWEPAENRPCHKKGTP